VNDQPKILWVKWWLRDWLMSDSRRNMSPAERGVYLDALFSCYHDGSIPADETALTRILGVTTEEFAATWPAVSKKFVPHPELPGRLINPRAARGIEEAEGYLKRQKEHGKRGGRPPKQKPSKSSKRNEKNPTLSGSSPEAEKKGKKPNPFTQNLSVSNEKNPTLSGSTPRKKTTVEQSNSRTVNSETDEQQSSRAVEQRGATGGSGSREDDPSFSFSENDDDRPDPTPDATAGTSLKWEPTAADVLDFRRMMQAHSGKPAEEPFAAKILLLAAGGSQAAEDYPEVRAYCDDKATRYPPRNGNGLFLDMVRDKFSPETPKHAKRKRGDGGLRKIGALDVAHAVKGSDLAKDYAEWQRRHTR
jgi:uncharacterized protein YdaU (DUF1376 family)